MYIRHTHSDIVRERHGLASCKDMKHEAQNCIFPHTAYNKLIYIRNTDVTFYHLWLSRWLLIEFRTIWHWKQVFQRRRLRSVSCLWDCAAVRLRSFHPNMLEQACVHLPETAWGCQDYYNSACTKAKTCVQQLHLATHAAAGDALGGWTCCCLTCNSHKTLFYAYDQSTQHYANCKTKYFDMSVQVENVKPGSQQCGLMGATGKQDWEWHELRAEGQEQ